MSVCAICWTVLWGAKTQQLLSGMCIPMGRSRKALSQLVVAFPTRQGRVCPACGQLHSLLVLGIHFRADVLPVMGWGHREGGLQSMGWKHIWHWLMPVAEPLQSIRLTCLCPAAMAVPSCHLPCGPQLGASRDSSCRNEPKNPTKNVTCISFICSLSFPLWGMAQAVNWRPGIQTLGMGIRCI